MNSVSHCLTRGTPICIGGSLVVAGFAMSGCSIAPLVAGAMIPVGLYIIMFSVADVVSPNPNPISAGKKIVLLTGGALMSGVSGVGAAMIEPNLLKFLYLGPMIVTTAVYFAVVKCIVLSYEVHSQQAEIEMGQQLA